MTTKRLPLALLIICLAVSVLFGQTTSNSNNFGQPANGSYHGSDIDNIQLNNGNLHIDIPLYSLSGRGPGATFKYVYDSKGWSSFTSNAVNGTPVSILPLGSGDQGTGAMPFHNMQWSVTGPLASPNRGNIPGLGYTRGTTACTVNGVIQNEPYLTYVYKEPSGASHTFQKVLSSLCGTQTTMVYAIDGSGYALSLLNPVAVIAPDGTRIYQTFNAQNVVNGWVMQDTNGNQITKAYNCTTTCTAATTITDTLHRTLNSDFVFNAGNGKYELTYYDSDGAPRTISVVKSPVSLQTHLCTLQTTGSDGTCTEYTGSWQLPTEIDLPNGTKYTITYNQNSYGTPASITLPSGATISYTWGAVSPLTSCGTNCWNSFSLDDAGPRVTSRTITGPDVPTATWNYAYAFNNNGTPGPGKATVTDANSNDTVHYFDNLSSWQTGGGIKPSYEIEADYFSGPATGTALKTVATDYLTLDNSWNQNPNGAKLPIHTTTTWKAQGNLQQRTETDYDSAVMNGSPVYWGNAVETREYGFGVGAYGTLTRKTHLNYAHLSGNTNYNSSYTNLNIANRVTEKQVYDGSGNLVADSKSYYDQNTVNAISGILNHVTPNTQYRGNSTQAQVCSAINPTTHTCTSWLSSTNHFDDLGHLSDTTDPGGHQTTFSYADSWSGATCGTGTNTYAFLTETDAPTTTNSQGALVQHRTQAKYFPCTGLKQSALDENDILNSRLGTTFTHELMLRPKTITPTDNGLTTLGYNDSGTISTTSTVKLDSTQNIVTQSVKDSLGREKQSQFTDPEGTVLVDRTYDSLGRVATVSNPYRASPCSPITTCETQYQYDALGRKILEIPPDGTSASNNVQTSYGAQTSVVVGLTTTVTDQAGHKHMSVTDALGRLAQVWEPDPATGSLVNVTQYAYDTLGNLTCVDLPPDFGPVIMTPSPVFVRPAA